MTRTKFDCKSRTWCIRGEEEFHSMKTVEDTRPGDRVAVQVGKNLWPSSGLTQKIATVVFDEEILPLQISLNKVAPTAEEIDHIDRRIALFVTESSAHGNSNGDLWYEGTTKCLSACPSSKAFAKLQSPKFSSSIFNGNDTGKDGGGNNEGYNRSRSQLSTSSGADDQSAASQSKGTIKYQDCLLQYSQGCCAL